MPLFLPYPAYPGDEQCGLDGRGGIRGSGAKDIYLPSGILDGGLEVEFLST